MIICQEETKARFFVHVHRSIVHVHRAVAHVLIGYVQ